MEDALYPIQTEEPILEFQQTEGHRARSKWSSNLTKKRQKNSEKPFRGRYVRAVPPTDRLIDLAWDATVRNAACHQSNRCRKPQLAIDIDKTDLLRKRRVRRPGRLILFLVDISGSMGGQNMQLAKAFRSSPSGTAPHGCWSHRPINRS
jgi:Mg-chelatase subunit ChlD